MTSYAPRVAGAALEMLRKITSNGQVQKYWAMDTNLILWCGEKKKKTTLQLTENLPSASKAERPDPSLPNIWKKKKKSIESWPCANGNLCKWVRQTFPTKYSQVKVWFRICSFVPLLLLPSKIGATFTNQISWLAVAFSQWKDHRSFISNHLQSQEWKNVFWSSCLEEKKICNWLLFISRENIFRNMLIDDDDVFWCRSDPFRSFVDYCLLKIPQDRPSSGELLRVSPRRRACCRTDCRRVSRGIFGDDQGSSPKTMRPTNVVVQAGPDGGIWTF